MTITKHTFESVATLLGSAWRYERTENHEVSWALQRVTDGLADIFEADNPRFDRERFYAAVSERSKP